MPEFIKNEAQNIIQAQNVTVINNYAGEAVQGQDALDERLDEVEKIAPGISAGLRGPVARFAVAMEKKLKERDHAHPDGWSVDTQPVLLKRLADKYGEFISVLNSDVATGKIRELAADIGNYTMMLADNAGALRNADGSGDEG